jgi:hypothetical protein
MTDDEYSDFLTAAQAAVEEKWEEAGGRDLTSKESEELIDMLDSFFMDKG